MKQAYEQLEEAIAAWSGMRHAVVCSSGTAALHLALEAFQLPPGSEIILPDFTMVACARAVILAGHVPVFIGCDKNGLMDIAELGINATKKTRVIMAVHIYGRRCNMEAIYNVAYDCGALVIEDSAEAHGVKPHHNTNAVCWSFYRNKIVHGEEGGAIGFPGGVHASRARRLRSLGFTEAHDFVHEPRGHNYRLANLLARPILECFSNLQTVVNLRRRAEETYNWYCPSEWQMPERQAPWVYDMKVPNPVAGVKALNDVGIAARLGFKPMHVQPEFCDHQCYGGGMGEELSRHLMYLPLEGVVSIREMFDILKVSQV